MTLPKMLAIVATLLFGLIGIIALFKNSPDSPASSEFTPTLAPLEIELDKEIQVITPAVPVTPSVPSTIVVMNSAENSAENASAEDVGVKKKELELPAPVVDLPEGNRIEELFNKQEPKLPIVETITYKSHVTWQKGRPAWLSDYASHYNTSKHFIARSLNGKPDYWKQELKEGDRFNVFRKDKNFQFYLVVDSSRCKMWFYYLDLDNKQKVLLKTYRVGLGRVDASKASGLLTPLGTYTLGNKIAIYKPKIMGNYQSKNTEMITVFGSRWIPFDKEVGFCTAPAKGFGIHGTPWTSKPDIGIIDNPSSIGKYESDGCIRLATPDIEELFAIIITKPTTIEIVRDFSEAVFANVGF